MPKPPDSIEAEEFTTPETALSLFEIVPESIKPNTWIGFVSAGF